MTPPVRALLLALCLVPAPVAHAAVDTGAWQRPVAGPVLRGFSVAANRYARGQHRGVDLGGSIGGSVRAACSGRVSFVGSVPGGGRTISMHCGRLIATYQQLASIAVRSGAIVLTGAALGTIGRSQDPRTARPHVHLGARLASGGRYLDPLSLIGAGPPALPALPPGARRPRGRPWLGPSPPRPALRPVALPVSRPAATPQPVRGWAGRSRAPSLPWTIWLGLLCVGLGMPLGGFVTLRRRRRPARGARSPEGRLAPAGRWPAS